MPLAPTVNFPADTGVVLAEARVWWFLCECLGAWERGDYVWRSESATRTSRARRYTVRGDAAGYARQRKCLQGATWGNETENRILVVRQGSCGLGWSMHCYGAVVKLSEAGARMTLGGQRALSRRRACRGACACSCSTVVGWYVLGDRLE